MHDRAFSKAENIICKYWFLQLVKAEGALGSAPAFFRLESLIRDKTGHQPFSREADQKNNLLKTHASQPSREPEVAHRRPIPINSASIRRPSAQQDEAPTCQPDRRQPIGPAQPPGR